MVVSTQNNNHFIKFLYLIKVRPGMYFRTVSVSNLRYVMYGYSVCETNYEMSSFFETEKPSFYDWIHMKEGTISHPALGWVESLEKTSSSDEEAFNKFFRYLDDFLIRQPTIIHTQKLTKNAQDNYQEQAFMDKNVEPIRVEIVSYDKNVDGVFLRFFDKNNLQINEERHCKNKEYAIDYLESLEK